VGVNAPKKNHAPTETSTAGSMYLSTTDDATAQPPIYLIVLRGTPIAEAADAPPSRKLWDDHVYPGGGCSFKLAQTFNNHAVIGAWGDLCNASPRNAKKQRAVSPFHAAHTHTFPQHIHEGLEVGLYWEGARPGILPPCAPLLMLQYDIQVACTPRDIPFAYMNHSVLPTHA
jgi:hypothetical protein